MSLRKGDRVLVNVAPFIGSAMYCDDSIPCEVLAVETAQVYVRVEPPYRDVSLWVLADWVEERLQQNRELISAISIAN